MRDLALSVVRSKGVPKLEGSNWEQHLIGVAKVAA